MRGPTNAEACRFHPMMRQEAGWPTGHMPRSTPRLPCGRAEPAPPRDGQAMGRRPSGGKPGDGARGGFLGGTHSVRPRIRVESKPGRVTLTDGLARGSRPKRGDIRFSVMPPLRACGARPSARWPSEWGEGLPGANPEMRERRFSRRDALCASELRGPANAEAFHLQPMG